MLNAHTYFESFKSNATTSTFFITVLSETLNLKKDLVVNDKDYLWSVELSG